MADKISQEGTLKDKGPRISDWSLRTTSRAEQSLLTGRKPRVSGKGDEELLNGLSTTGAYGQQTRDRPPEKAQKHILGVQGQNQAWQISTGISTGGECGQQGRLMQNYWNRRKAKGNEGTVTKDTENLNCSAPSVSQNSLPRFFLGPSSLQESSYRK